MKRTSRSPRSIFRSRGSLRSQHDERWFSHRGRHYWRRRDRWPARSCGDHRGPTSAYVQVPGSGLRLRANVLRNELESNVRFRTVMLHYAHAFFNQVAQSAACAHLHNVEQRCCRWLLMTHDRVQSDEFMLTQEFLGMMLGVRRTSPTEVARALKQQKFLVSKSAHANATRLVGKNLTAC
jgi:hypothetical protein